PPPPTPRSCFLLTHLSATQIYTLSLHDALPIYGAPPTMLIKSGISSGALAKPVTGSPTPRRDNNCKERNLSRERVIATDSFTGKDRKSTRLNSSHVSISYAVFCLKKKKNSPQIR